MVEEQGFCADLAYRLKILRIEVTLSARRDDIPDLVRFFCIASVNACNANWPSPTPRRDPWLQLARQRPPTQARHREAAAHATGGIIGPEHLSITPDESEQPTAS